MAYLGCKKRHAQMLKDAKLPETSIVVDGFFGGGGLAWAVLQTYLSAEEVVVVAGENFAPLRRLYEVDIDLEALSKMVLKSFLQIGIKATWVELRDGLQGLTSPWRSEEAFVILNNLGYGNSMRHGKGRHNIQPCMSKIAGMTKRGRLINPVSLRPDVSADHWDQAIGSASGSDASFFGDPPYQICSDTYFGQDWESCAVPPVEMAMRRNYGCIGVFNNFSQSLHSEFLDVALQHGYSVRAAPTNHQTRFKPGAKPKGEEWFWVFLP